MTTKNIARIALTETIQRGGDLTATEFDLDTILDEINTRTGGYDHEAMDYYTFWECVQSHKL